MTNPKRLRRIALNGSPGAGKTSVIAALGSAGHRTVPEAGRRIIRERMACGGLALPWADLALYADRMIAEDIAAFDAGADAAGRVFFDCGLPDALGNLRLEQLSVPDAAWAAAPALRGDADFLFTPWEPVHVGDAERRQDFATAVRTLEAMRAIWTDLGLAPIEVPPARIADRAAFVAGLAW